MSVKDRMDDMLNTIEEAGSDGIEMKDLVKEIASERIVFKAAVRNWDKDEMGTFTVGDQCNFSVAIGDKDSRLFGSVKEHRDGGTLTCTVYWMDESGKVVRWDDAVKRGPAEMIYEEHDQFTMASTPPVVPDADGDYPVPVPGVYKAY